MKPERKRELSPKERAELHRELEDIFFGRRLHRRRRPRAVLVCLGGRVVGEATVMVGPLDPNWGGRWRDKGPKMISRPKR